MLKHFIKLARPSQWTKSAFVLIGPLYALADGNLTSANYPPSRHLISALFAAAAFALASSACYAFNDVRDAKADSAHPRKRHRPVASGAVSPHAAMLFSALHLVAAGLCLLGVPIEFRPWAAAMLLLYVLVTIGYTLVLKHRVIADVIGLAMGFVLRVLGGCAAVGITPTTWLLNVTFFLAMFLALGKRLGERRTLGGAAEDARSVHGRYSDATLQLTMIATGVVTLVTYAFYVIEQDPKYKAVFTGEPRGFGFNLLWLTILPATYGLFRSIVLMDRGEYDDPTELATKDHPFQLAVFVFVAITGLLMYFHHAGVLGK
jgi:decaprenyl-phosphate phosphoribosyltransferase